VIPGWRPAAVALVALVALGTGCAAGAEPVSSPQRPVLLISGRDDHGLLAESAVGLAQRPDGSPPTARVPDGTLVAVVETSGEWARVRTLEGQGAEGWVHDYYLRGIAHVACSNEPVELLAVRAERVRVRPADGGPPRWVPRDTVGELPTPPAETSRRQCPLAPAVTIAG